MVLGLLGVASTLYAQSDCSTGRAVSDPTGNPGLVDDCETLLDAKAALAGTAALNWSTGLSIDSWDGVTTGGTPRRVTALRLGSRGLNGGIPSELGDLSNLRHLDLRANKLSGSIPSELGDLSNLTDLNLDWNDLSGGIPSELGDLSNLRHLNLNHNRLSGGLPRDLGDLSNLVALTLELNPLSGSIPRELGKLVNLQVLRLQLCGLSGGIPSELGNLSNLNELGLTNNDLSGGIPSELGNLRSLIALELIGNDLSGSIPSELGNLSNLQYFRVSDNDLSGNIPGELGNLSNLNELRLSDNDLSGSIPHELGDLINLLHLGLSRNDLRGSIPRELGNLTNLRYIFLYDNDLSGNIPSELVSLSTLLEFYVQGNRLSGCVLASLRDRLRSYNLGQLRFCDEGPGKPEPPVVRSASRTSVTVSWTEPVNTGAAINDHDVQYRQEGSGDRYTDAGYTGTGTQTTITGLLPGRVYEVQVQATSTDGTSPWSEPGLGETAAPTVEFGAGSYTAVEGGSGVEVTVSLSAASVEELAVPVTASAGATTETGDYTVSVEAVTFAVGESSKTLTVTAVEDADSADETVELGFGELPVGVAAGTTVTATVTLSDNDSLTEHTCSSGAAVADPTNDAGLVADCEALLAATAELAGTGVLNWSADVALSTWDGVTTGGTPSRVTELRLGSRGLDGTLPGGLSELADLSALDLSGNEVSGRFPSELGSLSDLVELKVQRTRLSGCVPEGLRTQLNGTLSDLGELKYCDEAPEKPQPPVVLVVGNILVVDWERPASGSTITGYELSHRVSGEEDSVESSHPAIPTVATITTGLLPGRVYEVQVRASSADGTSAWSEPGLGELSAPTVEFGASSYTAVEGGAGVEVTVSLSAASVEELTVPVTASAGAETESGDYTVSAEAVTFAVGESSKTLTVTANEDADSADETVSLGFGELPVGVAAGTTVSAEVALSDNDPLTVVLSGPSGTVDGPFDVTVTFSEEVTGFDAADVEMVGGTVTVSGSGAEYVATVRPSGSGTVTVDVGAGAAQDDASNGNLAAQQLSVVVQYTCSSGVAVSDPTNNAGLVADCEALLAAKAALAGTGALNWSADVALSTWDGVTTGGTPSRVTELRLGSRGLDGTLPGGLSGLAELSALDVSDNEVSGRFPSELGDLSDLVELKVQQTRLSGCVPEGLRTQLNGTLSDLGELKYCDEAPEKPQPPVVLVVGNILVVDWERPASGSAITGYRMRYRVSGEEDSVESSHPAIPTVATITTGLLPGRVYEVQVRASSADGTSAWSEPGLGELSAPTVEFGASSYTAVEGGAGVEVTVSLSAASVEELTVPVTASAGAETESGDYTVSAEAVTFAVGESSKTLTVTANEDADSADETVSLGFGELPVGVAAGTTVSAEVALSDNDPLTVVLSGPSGTVDGPFDVTVTFSEEVTGFDAADVEVAGGTVTLSGSGAEYVATVRPSGSGTVTVDVGAGAAQDDASNGNLPAQQLSVVVQYTCSSGVAVPDPTNNAGQVDDCEALLGAKEELAGTGVLNWSADVALSTWDGVTTGGTPERVTELRLGSRGLDGTLPGGLSELADLSALDLSGNEVSGRFPSELGSLSDLVELKVQRTRLSGCVPEGLRTQLNGTLSDLGELKYCDEAPEKPQPPVVLVVGNILVVDWERPASGSTITGYELSHRVSGEEDSVESSHPAIPTVATITTGLLPGRVYEVQVRASSADGTSAWSEPGLGELLAPTVEFGASSYTAVEGGAGVEVTVSLSAASVEELTVPVTASAGAETESGDYTVSAEAVTFAVGESSKTLTVTANEDADSADETVSLGFGELPVGVAAGTTVSVEVALTDNDTASLAVSFGGSTYTAVEGGAGVTIPVRLNQPALQELRIRITATPRGTTAVGDYAIAGLTAGLLTFATGDDTKNITVVAVQDTDAVDEAVVIGFGGGVPAGSVATAEVTLEDDDTAPLTAAFGAASYTAVEGGPWVAVTVELSQPAITTVSVPITVQGQGTTEAADYAVSGLSADGEVEFSSGERVQTISVTAAEDGDAADEVVVLGFGAGVPPGTTARAVVTLQDDDHDGVSYAAASYRLAEGGAVTVSVKLVPAPAAAVTIPITVSPRGSTASSDYEVTGLSETNDLTFAADVDERSFIIVGAEDGDGDDEELEVRFGALPDGVNSGTVTSSVVTIVDDESTATRVSFSGASYRATEGGSGVAVSVSLPSAATTAVAVPITVMARGTTASGDYTVSGLTGGTLTIGVGQSTGVVTIAASEDTDAADEVVELSFGTLPPGMSAGVQASSEVTLEDNDSAALEVTYGAGTYAAAEGSTPVTVTVNLSQTAQSELLLPVTVTPRGTTTASDYTVSGLSAEGTLTFAIGDSSKTFSVSAVEDADAANEAVVLGFGGGVAPAGEPAVTVVTLQDNDTTALNVQFGASSYTATEGGAAAAVTVSLNQPAVDELAIPITATPRGTTQASDYSVGGLNADGMLAFAVGETSQTLTVTANVDADTVVEAVVLGFGGVVPSGAIPVAVVNLQEAVTQSQSRAGARAASAGLPEVSFVGTEHEVTEGASVSITVRLSGAVADSVTVPITATPRGATQEGDYELSGLQADALVFEAGDVEQTFTVLANEDPDAEHETVVLGFGTLPDSVTAGSPATTTVRIEDDERLVMERITRATKAVVPHLAQATTASVIEAISGRVGVARAGNAQHAEFDTAGLERLYQAVASRDRGGTLAGTGALPSLEQVLGDTAFALPVAVGGVAGDASGEPTGGFAPTVWATGDYRSLGSAESGEEDGVTWNGSLFSAHLGFDAPLSTNVLAGVALSWSRGAFEYRDEQDGQTGTGTQSTWTLSAHPYLSWTPLEALGLWATVGYGGGQLEVDDEAAEVQSSDMRRLGAAGGVQATLSDEQLLPGGTSSVTARGEGAYTRTDVAGRGLIEPLMAQVWRGRLAIEGAHERALPWGSRIRPALEVGVRYDGGEDMAGAGVEVGGGLRYAEPWGLNIEGRGRMLVAHQSGFREWAAGGRVSLDLRSDRQGMSVSVAPSYGRTASGVDRLWENGVSSVASTVAPSTAQGRVDAELSYGMLAAEQTLITPYGALTALADGTLRYQVGGKLDIGATLSLDLKGEYAVSWTGAASQKVTIRGGVRL